jgi:hypothetical protein
VPKRRKVASPATWWSTAPFAPENTRAYPVAPVWSCFAPTITSGVPSPSTSPTPATAQPNASFDATPVHECITAPVAPECTRAMPDWNEDGK